MKKNASLILLLFSALLFGGCVYQPAQVSDTPANDDSVEQNSLTYGALKKHLKVGSTTQGDVLKMFGSPNNMTLSSGGTEIWVYDKIRTEMSSNSSRNSVGGIAGGGFGVGSGAVGAGIGGSSVNSSSGVVSSTETLTVLMEFDKNSILTDYSIRTGRY